MIAQIFFSTRQNAVNIIPLLKKDIFGDCQALILTSRVAKKGKWTDNLIHVLHKKGLKDRVINCDLSQYEDHTENVDDYLEKLCKDHEQLFFNISGGKKSQILSLLNLYNRRNNDKDRVIYVENNPYEIHVYDRYRLVDSIPLNYELDLEDVLNLSGFTCCPNGESLNCYRIGPDRLSPSYDQLLKIDQYYMENEDFRNLMYHYFTPYSHSGLSKGSIKSQIRYCLSKPNRESVDKLVPNHLSDDYKMVADAIRKLRKMTTDLNLCATKKDLRSLWDEIKKIPNVDDIFNKYWSAVRDAIIDVVASQIEGVDHVLVDRSEKKRIRALVKVFKDIRGSVATSDQSLDGISEIKHSGVSGLLDLGKAGMFFENLTAAKIYSILADKDKSLDQNTYMNMMIYPLNVDSNTPSTDRNPDKGDNNPIPQVEYDCLVLTPHASLIAIECKTFGIEGDMFKAKQHSISTQGGVFSRSVLITHVQKQSQKTDGTFPDILTAVVNQLDSVKRYSPDVWYYDEIRDRLLEILELA